MDIKSTRESRLTKYAKLGLKKKVGVSCPVCGKPFVNNYSLSNHFLVRGYSKGSGYIDKEHESYYLDQKSKKLTEYKEEVQNRIYKNKCIRCGDIFQVDFVNRFQKKCIECKVKYPTKIKKPTRKTKIGFCKRCGKEVKINAHSTNEVCVECRKKERDQEVEKNLNTPIKVSCLGCGSEILYYKKHLRDRVSRIYCENCKNDPYKFKKDTKYIRVMELLEQTDLTRRDIKTLIGLEWDFVREAAIERFGEKWYQDRVRRIRKRGLLQASYIRPSSLEKIFAIGLQQPYSTNVWMHINLFGKLRKCEVDLKIELKDRKFAVLIDGETFHGKDSYFGAKRYKEDLEITKVLAGMGYFTVRYSETEVMSGWARKHFDNLYRKFLKKVPTYYYRNWMTSDECIK